MKRYFCLLLLVIGLLPARLLHAPPLPQEFKEAELARWQSRYNELESRAEKMRDQYANATARLARLGERYLDTASICEGRLTLLTGVAVPTADQANATDLHFTPFRGNSISLYTGSLWQVHRFTETSLDLTALGLNADTNYDVFAYLNAGNVNIILSDPWDDDVTRNDALATQDGVLVLSGTPARRYLGTIRMSSATETQDTMTQRFVWNYQNQVQRPLQKAEDSGANSWTYATNSWRQANADADNRVEYVTGDPVTLVHAYVMAHITNGTGTVNYYAAGLGIDSTSANSAMIFGAGSDNDIVNQVWGEYIGYPGVGYHAINWLERSSTTTITIYGDNGDATKYQSGIMAYIFG